MATAGRTRPWPAASIPARTDPMAISIANLQRQFQDFGRAVREGSAPLVDGAEGLSALRFVLGVYESARDGVPVDLA